MVQARSVPPAVTVARPKATNCRDDEHTAIVTALAAGDADTAESLMRVHLQHITQHLQLERAPTGTQDLVSLFGAA